MSDFAFIRNVSNQFQYDMVSMSADETHINSELDARNPFALYAESFVRPPPTDGKRDARRNRLQTSRKILEVNCRHSCNTGQ